MQTSSKVNNRAGLSYVKNPLFPCFLPFRAGQIKKYLFTHYIIYDIIIKTKGLIMEWSVMPYSTQDGKEPVFEFIQTLP